MRSRTPSSNALRKGFRRSPRLWGDHRDRILEDLEIEGEERGEEKTLVMRPMESELNLWRIVEKDRDLRTNQELLGLVMTYVDDMFIVGDFRVVDRVTKALRRCWKTSEPEKVGGEEPVRFLGMEVMKKKNQETGWEEWTVRQTSYVKDMLARGDTKERRIPITREQAADLTQPEETPTPLQVKEAQKVVGELLWTLTRTRPDLMFSMSRLCSNTLKSPVKVKEISDQVKGYLRKTAEEGLKFKKDEEQEAKTMRVYTDASFAPDGGESHGCVIVKVGSSLLAWKSGRQSMVTLSTAEAELLEVVEGFALGEATAVLVEEASTEVMRMGFTDSQAALAIMTGEGGSWRTRHLRMRATYARQLIQRGVWTLQHLAGEKMLADLGTKALTSTRMSMLKEELGMAAMKEEETVAGEREKEEEDEVKRELTNLTAQGSGGDVQKILKLVAILVQLQGVKGQGGSADMGRWEFGVVVALVIIGMITVVRWCWAAARRRMLGVQPEEEPLVGNDADQTNQSEEGPRRRRLRMQNDPWRTPDRSTNQSPRPSPATPSRDDEWRGSPSLSEEFVQEVRRQMLGHQRQGEPGGEPGTFLEDFTPGATVFEGYIHPEDWTPETHGDIMPGKGEPPPSYFGVRPKGGKKEGGKKEGGKKGRSVWASHGGGDAASSSSGGPQIPPFPSLGGSDGGKGRQTSDRSDDGSRNPGGSEPSG